MKSFRIFHICVVQLHLLQLQLLANGTQLRKDTMLSGRSFDYHILLDGWDLR